MKYPNMFSLSLLLLCSVGCMDSTVDLDAAEDSEAPGSTLATPLTSSASGSHTGALPAVHMELKDSNGTVSCSAYNTPANAPPVIASCPVGTYEEHLFDAGWRKVGNVRTVKVTRIDDAGESAQGARLIVEPINGSRHTFHHAQTTPREGWRNDVWVAFGRGAAEKDSIDLGPSEPESRRSFTTSIMPTAPGVYTVFNYAIGNGQKILTDTKEFVQHGASSTAEYRETSHFGPDRGFGQLSSAQSRNWFTDNAGGQDGISGASHNYEHLSIKDNALRIRYVPTPHGHNGTKTISLKGSLPPSKFVALEQTIYWEGTPDFGRQDGSWMGRGVAQTAKLGFGLGESNLVSGGNTDPSSWTARWIMRNGRFGAYIYSADRGKSIGLDVPTNVAIQGTRAYRLRMEVRLNDSGQANGTLRMLIDGVEVASRRHIEWMDHTASSRTPANVSDVKYLSTLFGGGNNSERNWAPSREQYIRYSDVVYEASDLF